MSDPIQKAIDALEPFAVVAEKIKEHSHDNRWLEQPIFYAGDDDDPQKWTITGNGFYQALKAIQALRGYQSENKG
jgi:hypothetical protein